MDTRTIIDYAMNDDAKAMRDALYASIHDRVNAHIQAQKQEVAQNIFPEEVEEEYEEIDESSGNNEKRHLDSIIKMKEVKKSKHDMAPSIHDHMEDALEKGNHKKIDQLHKVFKHVSEEVEQIDELSLQTMKSAKEKLGSKALDAHYNDDKRSARNYAGRALHMGAKIKRKERSASSSVKEEVEELTEGKMDKMTLSALWHKHAQHQFGAENGYGGGEGGQHSHHAATAIENHVRKHYGNKVADDMLDHSDHQVARVEYAGRDEYEHHEKEGAKLRAKHKISGDLLGPDRN